MNRFKLLVAAALLGLPLAACEEGTAPPPVGQIDGQVVIEGEGIDGVSVTLSSGAATTTSGGGHFSFMDVEGGTYTITISGFPADASFSATTAEVTIATSGQSAAANFSGAWIRTASLMGMVTVEGEGLPGITVNITGRQDAQMLTDDNGQYTFTGLRAGNYTVEITGYDATGVAFSSTSSAVTVGAGESKVWSFEGTYVRESAISGQVSVEGNGLSDVTVSLQGMGSDDEQMTDAGGQYTFSNLRAGEYQLAISGYDTDEYGFSTTSATVRVEHGRTANVPFEGILLRTATVMGQVSIEGEGLADVTVSLSGEGENQTTMTDAGGQYTFTELPAGNFAVGISGYDTDDYSFETTSKNVAVALGGTATVPFEGILLRTSGIAGRVSVDGMGIEDVTVTLSGDDLEEDVTAMTDATGQYAIAGLAEGDYTVAISGYDAVEYAFEDSQDVTLAKDATAIVNFTGKKLRTAAVMVTVTADGTGVAGVGATLIHITNLATQSGDVIGAGATGADGSHTFSDLLAGAYAVQIAGADEEIDFASTTLVTQVATDMTGELTFAGAINRTASIAGSVTADGAGMAGVMVALSGGDDDVSMMAETGADGGYSFGGLRRGSYTVSITNPDEAMYSFANTSRDVSVGVRQAQSDVSFAGSLIMQSSINGQVSVGNAGLADVMVTLSGAASATDMTDASGLYSFTGLATGSYTVTIVNPDAEEYSFASMSEDIELGNSDNQTENFMGTSLRTASITVMVTAEGAGVASAVATLKKTTGKSEEDRTAATGDDGAHTFENLVAGTYQVDISGTDEEIDFADGTSMTVDAVTAADADAAFAGTYNRTASIGGSVTIDGAGMADVTVTLSGGDDDVSESMETLAGGSYSFPGLRRGEYTVAITNPDDAMYSFPRTEQDVDLGLGQEQDDISFAGSMVRQSSISGQVTVEGEALPGVTVTLSGAMAATDTTGADGLYAFLNLGSGDYTVSIANPDDAAYIFDTESMSMDFELGNSDRQSHDFGGTHTREASITGMLFVDEGTKNNLHDEGEHALAAAGVKVTLVGPTLLIRDEAETDSTGAFAFPDLRQGDYRLELSSPNDAVMYDFAYGGDASYDIKVGVGADGGGAQNLPYDITHQTINFTVNLRSGEDEGDALPGAKIAIFSDAAGATQIGTDMTDADGMASIRFPRAGRIGNTVHASIAAPAGDYDAAGGMQAVTWNSQYRMTDAANDGDIVNLKAEINFGGATVKTDFGGGMALGEWAISVSSDKSAGADTPAKLGATGTASYSEVVMADSLPVTYKVKVAGNQANTLDGGESYEADSLMHTHNGLSLPAAVDMGMMEVTYTTQTLKVYTYHERDQVEGYTGNVLGGDARASGILDVNIRHLDTNGRSRAFPASARIGKTDAKGVVTFTRVPAAANVIVNADENADAGNIMLLRPDELAAYEDRDENGIMGGAFGANGGYHHTVELCPLMRVDPTGQDHGECASFAFVSTYAVHGQAWKNAVYPAASGDGFTTYGLLHVVGTRVTMTPVDGKNIAGESESFTAAATNSRLTAHDDRKQFVWGQKAAGAYTVGVPAGWVAQRGTPDAATNDLAGHINPLAGDLQIDVTPTTGFVYGRVTDENGFAVADVTVNANGVSATSDEFGRYHAEGFAAQTRRIGNTTHTNMIFVETSHAGHDDTREIVAFAANTPTEVNVTIEGEAVTATVAGTVTSGGDPVEDVTIHVNGADKAAFTTKADGEYSVKVPVGTVTITARKAGMSFQPAMHEITVPTKDVVLSGWNFAGFEHGTISGKISRGGRPLENVKVTATPIAGGAVADSARTGVTGTYSLSVPFGQYDVAAEMTDTDFTPATQRVNVGPGESKSIDDFAAVIPPSDDATLNALSLSDNVDLDPEFASDVTTYTAAAVHATEQVTVTATANDADAEVEITPADADDATDGHQVDLAVGPTTISVEVTAADESTETYTVTVTRADPPVLDDATLTSLTISEGTLDPEFAADEIAYTASVANSVASLTVSATENHDDATTEFTPEEDADDTADGHQVDLVVGANPITAVVTAADGTTKKTYTVVVTRLEEVPSAPQQLAVTSPGAGELTVTWRAPANEGADGIDRYQYRVIPGEWVDVDAVSPVTETSLMRSAAVTGLVDGRPSTIEVRAVASAAGDTTSVGHAESVTGTSWSNITGVGTDSTTMAEGSATIVTVQLGPSGAFFAPTRVELSLSGEAGASFGGAETHTLTFQPGVTSMTATVTADDNLTEDDAANNTFTVTAKIAETEAEDRDVVDGTHTAEVTVTDDDEAPDQPSMVPAGVAGGIDVTITAPSDWGTAAEASRKYQWRYKITSATGDGSPPWSAWADLAADATTIEIRNLLDGVGYSIELKAVTAAGESTAATTTDSAGAE